MTTTVEKRGMREFWVENEGRVSLEQCFTCQQDGVWWCPGRGFSGSEGHQFFESRQAAVLEAERWISEQRAKLDAIERALSA